MPKRRKEKPEVEELDCSELQPELVESIARKLTDYADYVKFRAVCMKWRLAVSPKPHHLPVQFPWLMLTYPIIENFFSPLENKIHSLGPPPEMIHSETRCCGSSLGWIALVDKTPNILLFNPITRIQFQLPPVTTFPGVLSYDVHNLRKEYLLQYPSARQQLRRSSSRIRDCLIQKVVLSSSPSSPKKEDFIVVAIFLLQGVKQLAFCKKGDESWTIIDDARSYCEDVIFYKGLFYALNKNGSIAICDVSGYSPLVTIVAPSVPLSHHAHIVYLVDSFGELLLVTRHLGTVYYPKIRDIVTCGFDVFRLDASLPNWVAVDSLGDHMLFLGTNSSLCLLATDFSGSEGNRIYFTYGGNDESPDSGVFNVRDGSFEYLPHCPRRSRLISPSSPIWVTPNPC